MSDGLLAQTLQRIMSVLDDIDERKADIKEIYAEAKSQGYDKTALGLAIREIRGRDKAQTPAAEERAAIVDLYVSAFDNAPRTYVHVPAREAAPRQNPSEGEVGSAVRSGAPESPEPDATPAGAVVAETSGVTAGETAAGARNVEATVEQRAPAPSRKPYVLRPHCQRPDMCASYGSKHCGECERLAKAADDDDGADAPAFVRKTHQHAMGEQA